MKCWQQNAIAFKINKIFGYRAQFLWNDSRSVISYCSSAWKSMSFVIEKLSPEMYACAEWKTASKSNTSLIICSSPASRSKVNIDFTMTWPQWMMCGNYHQWIISLFIHISSSFVQSHPIFYLNTKSHCHMWLGNGKGLYKRYNYLAFKSVSLESSYSVNNQQPTQYPQWQLLALKVRKANF